MVSVLDSPVVVPRLADLLRRAVTRGPTVTDLFCGAGGSSLAAVWAGYEVTMAVNHWPLSVATHAANLGAVAGHDCADITLVDPRRYPRTDVLLAAPECIGHSTARNGSLSVTLPAEMTRQEIWERSRALMEEVPRWAAVHGYSAIIVENVVDARQWGPSWDPRNGRLFDAWIETMRAIDYEHRVVYFNAMITGGVPQSRDRMYVVFWRRGRPAPELDFQPAAFCQRCETDVHAVQAFKAHTRSYARWGAWGRYGRHGQCVYRCPVCSEPVTPRVLAAEPHLRLDQPGPPIADRAEDPLKPKTLARVRAGLDRHGPVAQIVNTCYPGIKVPRPVTEPLPTLTAQAENYLLTVPDHAISANGRVDTDACGFRMLEPAEVQAGMGFPADYRVLGSRRDQQRQLGNAVCPAAMRLLLDRLRPTLAAA